MGNLKLIFKINKIKSELKTNPEFFDNRLTALDRISDKGVLIITKNNLAIDTFSIILESDLLLSRNWRKNGVKTCHEINRNVNGRQDTSEVESILKDHKNKEAWDSKKNLATA